MTELLLRMLTGINTFTNALGDMLQVPVAVMPGWLSITILSRGGRDFCADYFQIHIQPEGDRPRQGRHQGQPPCRQALRGTEFLRGLPVAGAGHGGRGKAAGLLPGADDGYYPAGMPGACPDGRVVSGPPCAAGGRAGHGTIKNEPSRRHPAAGYPRSLPGARLLAGPVQHFYSRDEVYFNLQPVEYGNHTLVWVSETAGMKSSWPSVKASCG